MPKVFATQTQRDEARARSADEAIRIIVSTRMMRDRITQKEIAERVGLAPVTLSRRLAKPESFTVGELRRLAGVLEMSDAEAARCL